MRSATFSFLSCWVSFDASSVVSYTTVHSFANTTRPLHLFNLYFDITDLNIVSFDLHVPTLHRVFALPELSPTQPNFHRSFSTSTAFC
eukprot:m.7868 g.7868  ORF g.7868 m.7868 type:complete len:88 (+) comp5297_c0_seq1:636-899(+)